jgi:predicted DNA-binding transcriptional regulator YafY
VQITYRARDGRITARTVNPYGVVFQSGHWYLAGWDHLRRAERTFRLDRVKTAVVTNRTFQPPEGFDAVAQVQQSIAAAPWAWTVEAVLDLTMQEARRRVSPTVGKLEQQPDGVLLRMGADDLNWAVRYLVGLDCRFAVRRPPQMRETLGRLARELAAASVPDPDPLPLEMADGRKPG